MVLRPRGRGRVGRRRHLVRPGRITDHRDAARSLFVHAVPRIPPDAAGRCLGLPRTGAGSAQRRRRPPWPAPQTLGSNNTDLADGADPADHLLLGSSGPRKDCCPSRDCSGSNGTLPWPLRNESGTPSFTAGLECHPRQWLFPHKKHPRNRLDRPPPRCSRPRVCGASQGHDQPGSVHPSALTRCALGLAEAIRIAADECESTGRAKVDFRAEPGGLRCPLTAAVGSFCR